MHKLVLVTVLLATTCAYAQDEKSGLAPPKEGGDDKWGFSGLVDARLGVGMIDEDLFLNINVGTALQFGKLGFGIQAPLRLRVWDRDPENKGVFRKEDWDEVSDWTRVVRFVSWGKPSDWLYARLGVLEGTTLGHATIVDRYYNVIDSDHYQTGVQVNLDLMEFDIPVGIQTFMDNLMDPEIWALRAYVRPFGFVKDLPKVLNGFVVGTTIAVDFFAPLDPKLDVNGRNRVIDDTGNMEVSTSNAFVWGLDIGWEFQPTDWVAITPYMDVNVIGATAGAGMHLGVLTTFDIMQVVTLGMRVEYRAFDAAYAPSYFNSFYEVERLDFLAGQTKLLYLLNRDAAGDGDTLHGWHAALDLTILKAVTISGILEDYQGPNNGNLMLRLQLPYIAGVKLAAYYAKRNFDGFEDAFDLDRGLLVAEAKYKFWGPMFAYARYSREWRLNKDKDEGEKAKLDGSKYGTYETINDWDAGVGVEFNF